MTLREALRRLLETAQRFEMKSPKYRRVESERQALQDAMTYAQLVLSVQESPQEKQKSAGSAVRPAPGRALPRTRT